MAADLVYPVVVSIYKENQYLDFFFHHYDNELLVYVVAFSY